MKTIRSVIATLRAWLKSKRGMTPSAQDELTVSREDPIPLSISYRHLEGDEFPLGLPNPKELRVVATYLTQQMPVAAVLDLVRAKDYTAAHELAGFHEALQAIHSLADGLEDAEAQASTTETVHM